MTGMIGELSLKLGVKRLIYTGTIDSYYAGSKAGTITEETAGPPDRMVKLHARSKTASEEILLDPSQEQGLPPDLFDPGSSSVGAAALSTGVSGMRSWNAICRIWGRGDHPLPFVLVEDVARALVLALQTPGYRGRGVQPRRRDRALGPRLSSSASSARRGRVPETPHAALEVLCHRPRQVGGQAVGPPPRSAKAQLSRLGDQPACSLRLHEAREMLGWRPVTDREALIRLGIQGPCSEFIGVAPTGA